jgi:HEAT repeat protein
MKRLRWVGISLAIVAMIVGTLLVFPTSRYLLLAYVRNEPLHDDRPMSYWAYQLRSDDPAKRHEAVVALGQMGADARDAVPSLAAALRDSDDKVRLNVALTLYKIGPDAVPAVPQLGNALLDDHPQVRMNSALALTRMGAAAEPALPQILVAYQNPENVPHARPFNHSVKQQLARLLGRIGPPSREAVPALIASLTETDSGIRANAAFALGRIGPEAALAIPALELCLNDENEAVRENAQTALNSLRPPAP